MSGGEPFVKFIPIEVALPAPRLVLLDQESPEETVGRFGTGEDPDHPLPSAIDGSLRTQSSPSEKQNRSRILWREARRVLPLRSSAFSPTPRSASSCACARCSPASSRAISSVARREADESDFGSVRKGKRGHGAASKVVVFGL